MRPGETHTLNTYLGHKFVFTNQEDGTCLTLGDFRLSSTHKLEFLPNGLQVGPKPPSGPTYTIIALLASKTP